MSDHVAEVPGPPSSQKAQEVTGQLLQFLAEASNETLGACLVGLAAATYLVLGRIGLLLIGVVAGVVLHATWEGQHKSSAQPLAEVERKRKETGLDILKRVLDWEAQRTASSIESDGSEHDKDATEVLPSVSSELDFATFPQETATALNVLVAAVIRDYVKYVVLITLNSYG